MANSRGNPMEELLTSYEQAYILQGETFQLTFRLADLPRLADVIAKKLEDPRRGVNEAVKIKGSRGNTLVVPAPDARRLLGEIEALREISVAR